MKADEVYAKLKKMIGLVSVGIQNTTSTQNSDGSVTITINFTSGSPLSFTMAPVKGDKGVGIKDVQIKEIQNGENTEYHLILIDDKDKNIDAGNIPIPDITNLATKSDLTTHTSNTNIHITTSERTKWNKAITEDQLQGYIPYFPKTIQFGYEASTTSGAKWVKIFEFTPNRYDWNGGNFIIAFSFLNPANSYYPFGEYELIWACNSDGDSGITDVYLKQIISQNGDVCHTNGSALCVGISENNKTVGLYAFLGISTYQTMLSTIISGGSRYENNQFEIGKWINIDKPTVGLEEQPTFSKANYYSLADNLGGWTYTATKLTNEVDNKIEALKTSQSIEYGGKSITCRNTIASRTSDMLIKGQTHQNTNKLESAGEKENKISILSKNKESADDNNYKQDKKEILLPVDGGLKSLPNNVADTIEQRNDGVYLVQRVDKVVLNGSETWDKSSWSMANTFKFDFEIGLVAKLFDLNAANQILCDTFKVVSRNSLENVANREFESISASNVKSRTLGITISKTKLNNANTTGAFKQWLSNNPVTVYYELATPIETKLNIKNLDLEVYKDTTYIATDNTIQPTLSFKVPSNIGGIIQANSQNINELYKLIDEVIIPQLINNSADIEVLKLK